MGCVYSHSKTQSLDGCKSFSVMNVDDRGNEINPGVIQINDFDLILRQGDSCIRWPLRSLRRYGFDAQLFSFECGRRCPTGPGIYAFRCAEAEELFNLLQEAINNSSSVAPPPINGVPVSGSGQGHDRTATPMNIMVENDPNDDISDSRRGSSQILSGTSSCHQYANTNIHNYINSPIYMSNGESCDENGMKPIASQSLPTTAGVTDINTNYAKLDDIRYYVNVNTPVILNATTNQDRSESVASRRRGSHHGQGGEALSVAPIKLVPIVSSTSEQNPSSTPPSSPTTPNAGPVNYIQLDLDAATGSTSNSLVSQHIVTTAPATPVTKTPKGGEVSWTPKGGEVSWTPKGGEMSWTPKGGEMSWTPPATPDTNATNQKYAMIDFEKTEALTSASFQRRNL